MPKRRDSKHPTTAARSDPEHRPDQGAVERAIESVLDRLKPRGTGRAARKDRTAPDRER